MDLLALGVLACVSLIAIVISALALGRAWRTHSQAIIDNYEHEIRERNLTIAVLEANVENWGLVIESLKAREEIIKSRLTAEEWERIDDPTVVHTHWSDSVENDWSLDKKPVLVGCSYCAAGPGQQCDDFCAYPSLPAGRTK